MAGPSMKTLTVPCRGGLNLSSNNQELLAKPNEAIRLTNFEPSKQGGYRRISGYSQLNTIAVPNTGNILGVRTYNGSIVCRGDGVYHSWDDGDTYWVQVNYNTATDSNEATHIANPALPRTNAGRYMFAHTQVGTKEYILMVDGVNAPAVLSITGTDRATSMYRYQEITDDNSPTPSVLIGAQYGIMVKNNYVIAGMPTDPTTIFYSSLATTDFVAPEDNAKEIPQENFNGATSGSISVGDVVTGLAMHRDILYVFCETSIVKITGIDAGSPVVSPVTRDIGCIDGFSIQEVGTDLVFLAPDGLRTVAGTDKLNDLELGVISRKISRIIDPRVRQKERYEFNSTVIREKNQYRLWFTDLANADSSQRGIIAAYTYNNTDGSFSWDYAELEGLGITCVDNSYLDTKERIIHGNQSGELHLQESGSTFDGTRIYYIYQSPYTDLGDISIRKNIHKVFVASRAEGNVQMGLELRYDYESSDVHQPDIYPMEQITLPAIFGDPLVTFGDTAVTFGAADLADNDLFTEGSGFTVSFRVVSTEAIDDAPFDIQSLQIDLTAGGKI